MSPAADEVAGSDGRCHGVLHPQAEQRAELLELRGILIVGIMVRARIDQVSGPIVKGEGDGRIHYEQ